MNESTSIAPSITVPSTAEVLESIEQFLADTGMKPTRFGRDVLGEASFVATLRAGRVLTLETARRVVNFIETRRASMHDDVDSPVPAAPSPGKCDEFTAPEAVA